MRYKTTKKKRKKVSETDYDKRNNLQENKSKYKIRQMLTKCNAN